MYYQLGSLYYKLFIKYDVLKSYSNVLLKLWTFVLIFEKNKIMYRYFSCDLNSVKTSNFSYCLSELETRINRFAL